MAEPSFEKSEVRLCKAPALLLLQQGSEGTEGQMCARERRAGLTPLFLYHRRFFFTLWLYSTEHTLMLLQYRYR